MRKHCWNLEVPSLIAASIVHCDKLHYNCSVEVVELGVWLNSMETQERNAKGKAALILQFQKEHAQCYCQQMSDEWPERGTKYKTMHKNIVVKESPVAGLGMFAVAPIRKGEVVVVMEAEVDKDYLYTFQELESMDIPEQDKHHIWQVQEYLFESCIRCRGSEEQKQQDRKYMIEEGSTFHNHSCDPNTGFLCMHRMVAIKDINIGDEITYDYVSLRSRNCRSYFASSFLGD